MLQTNTVRGEPRPPPKSHLLVGREQVALALNQKCPDSDGDSINRSETRELWTDLAHKSRKSKEKTAKVWREIEGKIKGKRNESNRIENGARKVQQEACNKGKVNTRKDTKIHPHGAAQIHFGPFLAWHSKCNSRRAE